MIMTGLIADMLIRLRNVNHAYHDTVSMPYSKLKNAIANMLVEEGYPVSTSAEDARVGKIPTLTLKYGSHRESVIKGLQHVSKSGLRVYVKSTNLSKVRDGLGVATLSTSPGLLTDRQTADKGVGEEVLVYIW